MLDETWTLDASVALRPEPFGALAYHFQTRRLVFLKQPELVALLERLGEADTVREALVATGVPEVAWPAYVAALRGLADSRMIRSVKEVVR